MLREQNEQVVYYSPEFIKDFNKISRKHNKTPEDFDRFLKQLLVANKMPDQHVVEDKGKKCTGYTVIVAKRFLSKDLRSSKDCRVVYARRGNYVFFMELYEKSTKEKENKDRICKSLQTVSNGTCVGHYVKGDFPNSRALLRKRLEQ